MAIGQLLIKSRSTKNLVFFGLFADFALLEIQSFGFKSNLFVNAWFLDILFVPAVFLFGPFLYFFSRFSLEKDFHLRFVQMIHFIPAMLSTLVAAYVVTRYPLTRVAFTQLHFFNSKVMYLESVGWLASLFYMGLIARAMITKAVWDRSVLKNEPAARVVMFLFVLFAMTYLSDLLIVLTKKFFFADLSILLLTTGIVFLFFINFRYPHFYQTIQEIVIREKQKRSYLNGLDLSKIQDNLKNLMSGDELFRDEDLSLPSLAEKASLTNHQLSQFLNKEMGKGFKTYVNEYRIEKAKKLLIEDRTASVLSIAFEVGFKSKSSFNAVFRELTGMTPTGFRKETP